MSRDRDRRNDPLQGRGAGWVAAGRFSSLVSSVMDLHVRIALQEADSEKRRLISGGVLLASGLTLLMLALVAAELALALWLHQILGWSWIQTVLALIGLDLVLAGLCLRIGGQMLKGPYLPQTTAGLSRTTRALLGR